MSWTRFESECRKIERRAMRKAIVSAVIVAAGISAILTLVFIALSKWILT